MASKKKYTPKGFESEKLNDISANVYASMMQSKAWQGLTSNAIRLYLFMKLQYYGQKNLPNMPQEYFYFNRAMYKETYKLYTNNSQFFKDKDLLVKLGFIETIESGKNTRTKSIYKLSDKWKEYKWFWLLQNKCKI